MCLSQSVLTHEARSMPMSDSSTKKEVGESSDLGHAVTWEEDGAGMSMPDLAYAMNLDADSQVEMLDLLCNRLDEIVRMNDQRKVHGMDKYACVVFINVESQYKFSNFYATLF
jgi:hypothetical protein